jgi:TatD DNase family protein
MRIIDTHTHYNAPEFNDDIDIAVNKAKQAGVEMIFNNGDSLESFSRILQLSELYPSFCYSVLGIHPEFASKDDDYLEKSYQTILENKDRIHAIGEIGLDYHYSKDPEYIQRQKKVFIDQIRLAKRLSLPIVIHARDADYDTLNIIKEELPPKMDLHCFSGSVEILREYLKLPIDFHIGIGGVCTFKNARVIKEVIQYAPTRILLTETDAPYLAPVPHRGERNDSSYIPLIIHQIATLKAMDDEALSELLFQQGKDFYGV